MEQKPIRQSVDPKIIRVDLGTQVRKGNNEETIEEYAEAMAGGAVFPPLTVFFNLATVLYILADGFHRLIAHLRVRPNDPIIVEQYLGTVEDARWFSIGANKTHGLKRSNEDKRNAVEMALLHPNSVDMSDGLIADHVGVTQPCVSKIRKELIAAGRLITVMSRIGKDGRAINVSNIGEKDIRSSNCSVCGHYNMPRCMMDDDSRDPLEPACSDFIEIPKRETKPEDDGDFDDPRFEQDYVPKEVRRRIARRKPGEYVDVPLSKTNTDLAAAEIRHFFDENYLAALVQSALKLLRQ
ncbi:MAG TPA: hypothetical protein DEB39_10640 [Planctomycetaceae bacterium]|nr:hypothetical protein [Planctomycetaceae bacterium]